jgi:chemotaxis protein MotB
MAKRHHKVEEEPAHENAERWLLTYADMITLLVAFFIMMYSMSVMDIKKFNEVAIAIRSGFMGDTYGKGNYAYSKEGAGTDSDMQPVVTGQSVEKIPFAGYEEQMAPLQSMVKRQFAELKLDKQFQPVLDVADNQGDKVTVLITDQIFFAPGSSELTASALQQIDRVGAAMANQTLPVGIEGYASPLRGHGEILDSWQLGAERARRVAQRLVDRGGLNPRRLTLISRGEWKQYGRSRKVQLNNSGRWTSVSGEAVSDQSVDRVVVSVTLN